MRKRPSFAHRLAPCAFAALSPLFLACSSSSSGSPTAPGGPAQIASIYVVPASLSDLAGPTFYDQPWPSDLRLVNGSPSFTGYGNPRGVLLLGDYISAIQGLAIDGFSPAAAGYVRFDGAIDPTTLPATPLDSMKPTASVQLIDIDPSSAQHGTRQLISLEWREAAGVYWLPDTLAFLPSYGFPLQGHTRYAFVVTSGVKAAGGGEIARSADLDQVLGLAPAGPLTQAAARAFAPAVAELTAAGIATGSIVQFTVFTTADATAEMFALADGLPGVVAAPVIDPTKWAVMSGTGVYTEYVGWYGPSPNFQFGKIPFANYGDGGNFKFEGGKPLLANTFDLRFSLMVPNATACPMPANGYPLVQYAHGTGGDYESYVQDGTGNALAEQCVATMGIDQIFEGVRPGSPPNDCESQEDLTFFNFQNIIAARTNPRQAAADEIQRSRLFTESHASVPASTSVTGSEILFDPTKLMFFGHSEGGLNGPLYLSSDKVSRGGVLSGSGADITISLLEKTSPSPSVAALVKGVLLDLHADEESEVDEFHPAMTLAQSIVDVTDPLHYARFIITSPRAGFAAKSIYMTEGINPDGTGDSYAPPDCIEAHAVAMGLPVELPEQHAIADTRWGGPQPVTVPSGGLSGNLGGGTASGVLGQWAVPPGDDGHFVVFDVPAAQLQAARSIHNLGLNPKGNIPPP